MVKEQPVDLLCKAKCFKGIVCPFNIQLSCGKKKVTETQQ